MVAIVPRLWIPVTIFNQKSLGRQFDATYGRSGFLYTIQLHSIKANSTQDTFKVGWTCIQTSASVTCLG